MARGCKSKKVPFFFSRQGKTMHEAESTVRQLAEAPMNRIVYQAGCIDRIVGVAGESSEAMREVEDEGTQISVRLVEAGQGNPSHENVVLDNLLVRRGGYDELLLTLLVRTAPMLRIDVRATEKLREIFGRITGARLRGCAWPWLEGNAEKARTQLSKGTHSAPWPGLEGDKGLRTSHCQAAMRTLSSCFPLRSSIGSRALQLTASELLNGAVHDLDEVDEHELVIV